MRSDHVMVEEVDVLVLAVEAARAARVGEDEKVARPVRRAERLAPRLQPLEALLLQDRRAAGVLAREQHDDRGARLAPVSGDKGAALDHARNEARGRVLGCPVLLACEAPLPRLGPGRTPVGWQATRVVDVHAEGGSGAAWAVKGAQPLQRGRLRHVFEHVQQRRRRDRRCCRRHFCSTGRADERTLSTDTCEGPMGNVRGTHGGRCGRGNIHDQDRACIAHGRTVQWGPVLFATGIIAIESLCQRRA